MSNELENVKRLEAIMQSVARGVEEAKAGHFEAADAILRELRDAYDRERVTAVGSADKAA